MEQPRLAVSGLVVVEDDRTDPGGQFTAVSRMEILGKNLVQKDLEASVPEVVPAFAGRIQGNIIFRPFSGQDRLFEHPPVQPEGEDLAEVGEGA